MQCCDAYNIGDVMQCFKQARLSSILDHHTVRGGVSRDKYSMRQSCVSRVYNYTRGGALTIIY